jgi:hypothetical protein
MSAFDLSKLEKTADKLPEPEILEKGTQVEVKIISVKVAVSEKTGKTYVSPFFEVVSDDPSHLYNDFSGFLWEPNSLTEAYERGELSLKEYSRGVKQFVAFCKAFDIPLDKEVDLETDLIGKTGFVIVGVRTSDEYGTQNTVSQYVIA